MSEDNDLGQKDKAQPLVRDLNPKRPVFEQGELHSPGPQDTSRDVETLDIGIP
jgi:hypothetical protein